MMGDDSRGRRELKTQASMNSLKTYRYEDLNDGIPPRRRFTNASTKTPQSNPSSPATADNGSLPFSRSTSHSNPPPNTRSYSRPRTSPSPSSSPAPAPPKSPVERLSQLSEDIKRDSGIAHPPTTATSTSTDAFPFSADECAAREPSLPTIVVQNDEAAAVVRSRTSSRWWKSTRQHPQQVATPNIRSASTSPPRPHKMSSFEDIPTRLPQASASMENIGLEDLASDKVGFSTRGSILFGGRKMQDLIQAQGDDKPRKGSGGVISPTSSAQSDKPSTFSEPSVKAITPESHASVDEHQHQGPNVSPSQQQPRPLMAGRRTPSVQMLQAAIHGGRVLSAEEITFSMKVRTMYEHGDERAAEWVDPACKASSRKPTPESSTRNSSSPEAANGELSVNKIRKQTSKNWPPAENRARASYMSLPSREMHEVAGGIEDWENVDSQAVDRYGFIHSNRIRSATPDRQQTPTDMQRMATSLRNETEQTRGSRKSIRGAPSARSSKSVPPRPNNDWASQRGTPSIHSNHSATSLTRNPFRSKTQRLLAEASDMLTLPPGLEDIAETEDAGKTASSLKQREWAREEKWRKMARPTKRPQDAKGGGMHFDFDTTDPKLIERTWKGIPDRWRATAWHSFLSASARKRNSPATDEELIGQFHKLQAMSCADDVQIDVDVPRTIQLHIMFRRRYRGGQRLLFRLLHAMALYFPDVGYVQGMASIAVTLLCYYEEETAFVMMVRMWQLRGMQSFFKENFAGLMAALQEFEKHWLAGGAVHDKLAELSIDSMTYGTRWYLTLFNMSVPFPAQLRIWDVFMLLGDDPAALKAGSFSNGQQSRIGGTSTTLKGLPMEPTPEADAHPFGGASLDVLHATSAALIDATREIVLDGDFENAMKVLTSFIPIKDEDMLMRVARTEWRLHQKKKPKEA